MTATTLFDSTISVATGRPSLEDKKYMLAGITALIPCVIGWINGDYGVPSDEKYRAIEMALLAAYECSSSDGYGMARHLEDFDKILGGKTPNAILVKHLDECREFAHQEFEKDEIAWVEEHGLQPFEMHAKVRCIDEFLRSEEGFYCTFGAGEVVHNTPNGYAYVHFPHQGPYYSYVIAWEKLERAGAFR